MPQKPLVSIIVPTFNEEKDIGKTMKALVNLTYLNKEIIVIDDVSRDATVKTVKEFCKKYNYIGLVQHNANKGVGAARNTGLNVARGEIVIILNADTLLPSDFIEKILPHYKRGADYVLVSNPVANPDNIFARYIDTQYHYLYDGADWIEWTEGFSCCREAALSVGGFPEIKGASGEDAVFGEKLRETGYKKVIDRSIVVTHIAPPTLKEFWEQRMGRGAGSPRLEYFIRRKSKISVFIWLLRWSFVFAVDTIIQIRRIKYVYSMLKYTSKKGDFFGFLILRNIEEIASLAGAWKVFFKEIVKC